jgi:hypothetical protein
MGSKYNCATCLLINYRYVKIGVSLGLGVHNKNARCTVNYLLEGQESRLEETGHHWVLVTRAQVNLQYKLHC